MRRRDADRGSDGERERESERERDHIYWHTPDVMM